MVNVAKWVTAQGFTNVLLEIVNEYAQHDFEHDVIRTSSGMASLIKLAQETAPQLYVSASGMGNGYLDSIVASTANFLLIPHELAGHLRLP